MSLWGNTGVEDTDKPIEDVKVVKAPIMAFIPKEKVKGYPTELDHVNAFDLTEAGADLGEVSRLEDYVEKIDYASLKPSQRKDYEDLVNYLVQNSYYSYFKLSFDEKNPLIKGRHIRLLCNIMTRALKGEYRGDDGFTKIIITMPPRHLKSRTISESLPSYLMAKDPTRHVIACSYSADLGVKFGAKNKEKFETLGTQFFGVELNKTERAKASWETSKGAKFLGTGIGGSVTGFGADLLIVDDPFKNRQEANSEVTREYVWQEWEDTLKTRAHKNGIMIVIHTRWHDDDLIGRLLKGEDSHEWLLVNLPAECQDESTDLLGRKIGEPLWPTQYNKKYFNQFRNQKRTWSALYQQSPVVAGGNLFRSSFFRYFTIEGDVLLLHTSTGIKRHFMYNCWSFQTIDTALKEKESSDYTAMIQIIVTPDYDLLVRDIFNEKLEVPKQPGALISYRAKWQPQFQLIEEAQSGIFLSQLFKGTSMPIRTVKATKDKVTRSYEVLTYYEAGKVYHYAQMGNLEIFEKQLAAFPNVKHDDMVDALAHGGKYLSQIEADTGIWDASKHRHQDDDVEY
jgi:predicted phage terminase large subunit-like protein